MASKMALFGVHICVLAAASVGTVLAVGCSSHDGSNSDSEPTAKVSLALSPCDPTAAFDPPVPAFTGTALIDGITFSASGNTAYLSGKVAGATNSEIYVATRDPNTNQWSALSLLPTAVSSANSERSPSLSADGSRLYFARYLGGQRFNLMVSSRTDLNLQFGAQGTTTAAVPNVNQPDLHDQDPFFLSGLGHLYFAAEPVDGTRDIRVSVVNTNVNPPAYGSAQNVSVDPSQGYDEYRPILSADGLTVYFSSTRPGIGDDTGGDIFVAKRISASPATNPFGTPRNLSGLNTNRIEYPAALSNDGCTLYFASNRDTSALGDYRLYKATRGTNAPTTVSTTIKVVGSGSVTVGGSPCSSTCTFQGAPDSTTVVVGTAQAIWGGSCTGHGGNPGADGILAFTRDGLCTVTFPNGNPQPQGGSCTNPTGCQGGLECSLNVCRCPAGVTCACAPDCTGKTCGTEDGCGGKCSCGPGCNPVAPFNPPQPAFTRTTIAQGLTFSPDGLKAYVSAKTAPGNYDIYTAQRTSTTPFGALQALSVANGTLQELSPWLSEDGRSLYFTKQNPSSGYSLDLAWVNPTSTSGPVNFLTGVNTTWNDQDPFVLTAFDQLYYSSERPTGTREIYVCPLANCSAANSTALSVNSASHEDFRPLLTRDGRTLYFMSTRTGIGQDTEGDIWIATRPELNQPFEPVTNLITLNSSYGDIPVTLSADGCTLHFASNRDTGNSADFRLYEATRGTGDPNAPVTTTVKLVGTGTVTSLDPLVPFQCSGTCPFPAGAPNSTVFLEASGQALWSGSCARNGNGPTSTDGILVRTNGGLCTITFPNGSPQPQGGGCTSPAGCEAGLECTLNVCRCPEGSTTCTCEPTCGAGSCGAPDGCGGFCSCDECEEDLDCTSGLACVNGDCAPPQCATNPLVLGCGFPNAPCPTCTKNPLCTSDSDCPSGLVCPLDNGARYQQPGKRVCEDPLCATEPEFVGCGLVTSPCGFCPQCIPNCASKQCGDTDLDDGCGGRCVGQCPDGDPAGCESNLDCAPGSLCLSAELGCTSITCARVCRPADPCARPDLAPPACGLSDALCGPTCPPESIPPGACVDRYCGIDPVTNANCGNCNGTNEACSDDGYCMVVGSTAPVTVPAGPGANRRTVTPVASPRAEEVGTIEGRFSVTDTGSSSYSIPIQVPPGRAGIEPALALTYVSGAPNGAFGLGWSLKGLSSITLCKKTYALDGVSEVPKTFDVATEPYCLDGQRLTTSDGVNFNTISETFTKIVLIPDGSDHYFVVYTKDGLIHTYGRPGTSARVGGHTYALNETRDRKGNFLRVVYRNFATDGDPALGPEELLPAVIRYTGHGAADGDREIRFNYIFRLDTMEGFRPGGVPVRRSRRLLNIEVRAQNTVVRRYSLNYQSPHGQSLLTSIQEAGNGLSCSDPNRLCKPATTFTYHDEGIGFEPGQSVLTPPPSHAGHGLVRPYGVVTRWSPEDGWGSPPRTPMLPGLLPEMERRSHRMTSRLGPGAGVAVPFLPEAGGQLLNIVGGIGNYPTLVGYGLLWNAISEFFGDEQVEKRSFQFEYSPLFRPNTTLLPQYFQENLPAQHVVVGPTGGESIYEETYSPFAPFWLFDLDGDGVQDKLYCEYFSEGRLNYKLALAKSTPLGSHPTVPIRATDTDWTGAIPSPFSDLCGSAPFVDIPKVPSFVFDVDGDGTGNLVIDREETGWAWLDFRGVPLEEFTLPGGPYDQFAFEGRIPVWRSIYLRELNGVIRLKTHQPIPLDVNGDGLRDLLALAGPPDPWVQPPEPRESFIAINTGRGFDVRPLTSNNPADLQAPLGRPTLIVDLDGDGAQELLVMEPLHPNLRIAREWKLRRVRGSTIESEPVPGGGLTARVGAMGDFNGDGTLDLLTLGVDNTEQVLHLGKGRKNGLLRSVTNGLGQRIDVSYEHVNGDNELVFDSGLGQQPPAYDPTCRWPYQCSEVVKNVLTSSHTEGYYTSNARAEGDPFQTTAVFDYFYKGSRTDLAGHGWLGFWERRIRMRNAPDPVLEFLQGDVINDTTITYASPTIWGAGSSIPYINTLAGVPLRIITKLPATGSLITGHIETLVSETNNTWLAFDSAEGRAFPFMAGSTQTVRGTTSAGLDEVLFMRKSTFTPDAYGNTTMASTVSWDGDYPGITGTHTTAKVERTFAPGIIDEGCAPNQPECQWLISRPLTETTTSIPRCLADCAERTRVLRKKFVYYPGTTLLEYVYQQHPDLEQPQLPLEPELQLTTHFFRNDYGNIWKTERTDANGEKRIEETTYDVRELFPTRVTRFGEGQVHSTELRYDDRFGSLAILVDPNGIDETWSYDEWGIERVRTGPAGRQDINYIAGDSYVLSDVVSSGLPVTTAYAVDTTHASGASTRVEYNPLGQMVRRITRGYENTSIAEEFVYDDKGMLRQQTRPHKAGVDADSTQGVIEYDYDEAHRLKRVTLPGGGQITYLHALARDTGVPEWTHDFGHFVRQTKVKTASGNSFLWSSELLDRDRQPVRTIDGLGKRSHYFYGAFGQLRTIIDPMGRGIYFDHDALSRVVSVTDDARGGEETIQYNGFGNVVGTTDAANRTRTLIYDDFGRLEREQMREPGELLQVNRHFYGDNTTGPNEIGRLIRTESPSNQIVEFGYEAPTLTRNSGLMNSVTEHLVDPADSRSTRDFVTIYAFNDAAQLTRIEYPNAFGTAVAVDYAYDSSWGGHLLQVTDGNSSGLAWWQFCGSYKGLRVERERLNSAPDDCVSAPNAETVRAYDDKTGALVGIQTTASGLPQQSLTYQYDLAGRMKRREDTLNQFSEDFGYDGASRLTHVNGEVYYEYDPEGRGRLTKLTSERGTRNYEYEDTVGRDWIKSAGAFEFDQDEVGNVIEKRSGTDFQQIFEYTPFDLPEWIRTTKNGVEFYTDFAYDASRRRVVKTSSNGTTYYAQDLYQEVEAPDGPRRARAFVYVGGRPIAQLDASEVGTVTGRALLADALGSIRSVMNPGENRDFTPFGEQRNASSSFAQVPLGFTGHEEDQELGLINMRARLYDPELGQFLQADPKLTDGTNRFAYVRNSPLNFVDPTGMSAWSALKDGWNDFTGRSVGDNFTRIVEFVGTTVAAGVIAQNYSGPTLLTRGAQSFHALVNGAFAGWRQTYDWSTLDGWEAFSLDHTHGILGTALGNGININNAVGGLGGGDAEYWRDESRRKNRQVYKGGFYFQGDKAHTQGSVMSNVYRHRPTPPSPELMKHEQEHINTSRVGGLLFQTSYLAWFGGAYIAAKVRGDSNDLAIAHAYFRNPWEQHAYCNNPGGYKPDPNWDYDNPATPERFNRMCE